MLTNQPVKFDLLGANLRTREVLAMAFRGPAREVCELADGSQADAVIVDLDGVGALKDWKDYHQRHPDRPCIAMTIGTDPAIDAVAILHKPIQVTELVKAVNIVRQRLRAPVQLPAKSPAVSPAPSTTSRVPPAASRSAAAAAPQQSTEPLEPLLGQPSQMAYSRPSRDSQAEKKVETRTADTLPAHVPEQDVSPPADFSAVCGTASDIDCKDPQQVQRLSFDTGGTLFDWVRFAAVRSESSHGPVTLIVAQREIAIVNTTKRLGIAMVKDDILKHLCIGKYPAALVTVQSTAAEKLSQLTADGLVNTCLEALLWKLALWTYRGRLPKGTPINERFYLKHWPNLTRLLEVPDAMRIAALLVEQPMALPHVAEALAIPQRHVFAFYGAAHAIGLARIAQRADSRLMATEPPPRHIERGFMQRIVRHLRKLVA